MAVDYWQATQQNRKLKSLGYSTNQITAMSQEEKEQVTNIPSNITISTIGKSDNPSLQRTAIKEGLTQPQVDVLGKLENGFSDEDVQQVKQLTIDPLSAEERRKANLEGYLFGGTLASRTKEGSTIYTTGKGVYTVDEAVAMLRRKPQPSSVDAPLLSNRPQPVSFDPMMSIGDPLVKKQMSTRWYEQQAPPKEQIIFGRSPMGVSFDPKMSIGDPFIKKQMSVKFYERQPITQKDSFDFQDLKDAVYFVPSKIFTGTRGIMSQVGTATTGNVLLGEAIGSFSGGVTTSLYFASNPVGLFNLGASLGVLGVEGTGRLGGATYKGGLVGLASETSLIGSEVIAAIRSDVPAFVGGFVGGSVGSRFYKATFEPRLNPPSTLPKQSLFERFAPESLKQRKFDLKLGLESKKLDIKSYLSSKKSSLAVDVSNIKNRIGVRFLNVKESIKGRITGKPTSSYISIPESKNLFSKLSYSSKELGAFKQTMQSIQKGKSTGFINKNIVFGLADDFDLSPKSSYEALLNQKYFTELLKEKQVFSFSGIKKTGTEIVLPIAKKSYLDQTITVKGKTPSSFNLDIPESTIKVGSRGSSGVSIIDIKSSRFYAKSFSRDFLDKALGTTRIKLVGMELDVAAPTGKNTFQYGSFKFDTLGATGGTVSKLDSAMGLPSAVGSIGFIPSLSGAVNVKSEIEYYQTSPTALTPSKLLESRDKIFSSSNLSSSQRGALSSLTIQPMKLSTTKAQKLDAASVMKTTSKQKSSITSKLGVSLSSKSSLKSSNVLANLQSVAQSQKQAQSLSQIQISKLGSSLVNIQRTPLIKLTRFKPTTILSIPSKFDYFKPSKPSKKKQLNINFGGGWSSWLNVGIAELDVGIAPQSKQRFEFDLPVISDKRGRKKEKSLLGGFKLKNLKIKL